MRRTDFDTRKLSWAFVVFCVLVTACASARVQENAGANSYRVGEFKVRKVVDGDTIAVEGLEKTVRMLCIDTEECEKGPGARARTRALERRFQAYARARVRIDPLGQFNTPLGWTAKSFAEAWFPVGSRVRIEYDSLSRKSGYYGRVLGYVFVERDGKWVNYNVECVRAGMSPYFDKYGTSKRFEARFIAAEREARIHARGIWSPYAMAYPNYNERLVRWHLRADTLRRFEERYSGQETAVSIMDEDDWQRLEGLVGKEVLLLSTVKRPGKAVDPPVVELHHKEFQRLAVTFSGQEVFTAVQALLDAHEKDFVYIRGVLQPGFDVEARRYRYRVEVSDWKQVFVDVPGGKNRRPLPRKPVQITGDRISWKDAGRHVGRNAAVVGTIRRTKNIGSITFLNFARRYRGTLTLVIKKEHYEKFPAPPATVYLNRTVVARGKVTVHKGAPQIVITGPEQIEILE